MASSASKKLAEIDLEARIDWWAELRTLGPFRTFVSGPLYDTSTTPNHA